MTLEVRTAKTSLRTSNIKRLRASMIDGDIGEFELELLQLPPGKYGNFPAGHTSSNWIEFFRNDENIFGEGFGFLIEQLRPTNRGGVIIRGRSYEALLADKHFHNGTSGILHFGMNDGKVEEVLKFLATDTNSKAVGAASDIDTPASVKSITGYLRGETYLELFKNLTAISNQWFFVKRQGSTFRVFAKNTRGRGSLIAPARLLSLGKELDFISGDKPLKIINRVIVEGNSTSNVKAIRNNTASQAKFGIYELQIKDPSIGTVTGANNRGDTILAATAFPPEDANLTSDEFIPDVFLGDYVRVFSKKRNFDKVLLPRRIDVAFILGRRDRMDVEFDTKTERLAEGKLRADKALTDIQKIQDFDLVGDMGDYFFDTGWITSNPDTDSMTMDGCGGQACVGDCGAGSQTGVSITIPSIFTVSSTKIRGYNNLETDGLTDSSCRQAGNKTTSTTLECERECTSVGRYGYTVTESGDKSGDTYIVQAAGSAPSNGWLQRVIVGWFD